jgi:apolipoprotein N-acyltransferase
MKKALLTITRKQIFLAILSGLLLGLSWHKPCTFLIFIAFVPLFSLLEKQENSKYVSYLTFVIWNLTAYWWLSYVGMVAFLFAVFANALLMLLPVALYKYISKKTENKFGLFAFVVAWISFEYLHTQNWGFSWTWLNIGNAFGNTPTLVQWYEYTGVFGGSAWVLLINYLIFKVLTPYTSTENAVKNIENIGKVGNIENVVSSNTLSNIQKKYVLYAGLSLFIPIIISLAIFYSYQEKGKEIEIVVLQPNFDTYTQKFAYNARTGETNTTSYIPFEQQFEIFLGLIRTTVSPKTALVVLPETAWNEDIDENSAADNSYIFRMNQVKDSFPNLSVLSGADSYAFYVSQTAPTQTARYHSPNTYYDVFNTAMFIDWQKKTQFYHKSMLVVGVESNPLRALVAFLQKTVMQNMYVGDLGTQAERTVFTAKEGLKLAPIICYESIYGEYVTEYTQKGANIFCIITNDGWWDDSPAPRQHLSFASLRAIENRRAVARSANTGISAFINQKGEIIEQSAYNTRIGLRNTLKMNEEMTFYSRFGDIIARFAIFVVAYLLLTILQKIVFRKKI